MLKTRYIPEICLEETDIANSILQLFSKISQYPKHLIKNGG